MIDYGNGQTKINGKKGKITHYISYEYASNGTLYDYLTGQFPFLEEQYVKIIFKNIAKGFQIMHKKNICHRDIKLQNILLGPNFIPIICDFGFAYFIKKDEKLIDAVGTIGYMAPELYKILAINDKIKEEEKKEKKNNKTLEQLKNRKEKLRYDGKKIDIFSLGIMLLRLVVQTRYPIDKLYEYIVENKVNQFFEEEIKKELPKEEVQRLIKSMINYYPQKRPSIDKILSNKWLKDINENDLNLINDEFEKRKIEIEKRKKTRTKDINNFDEFIDNRSAKIENKKIYFEDNFELQIIDDKKINIKDYIQINGSVEPMEFMNLIANTIKNEINKKDNNKSEEREFIIKEDENYFKFVCIFKFNNEEDEEEEKENKNEEDEENEEEKEENEIEEDEEDEENEEEKEDNKNEEEQENEEEKGDNYLKNSENELKQNEEKILNLKQYIKRRKNLKIEVQLLKSIYDYHLLIFNKISGEIDDYYDILETIISIIKDL